MPAPSSARADAAGADAVVVSDGSVDAYAPKVVRSTAGSLFHLPVVSGMPVPAIVERLRTAGLTVLAADGAGDRTVDEADLATAARLAVRQRGVGTDAPRTARSPTRSSASPSTAAPSR